MKTILSTIICLWLCDRSLGQNTNNGTLASNDTSNNKIEFSISPGFSIVKTQNDTKVKKASVNLFVGYANGLDGFQIASLVNICNGSARYFQGAGLCNVVKGNFTGYQGVGLVNVVTKKTNGMQSAGLINVSIDSVTGIQAAGLANATLKNISGVQVAGLFNVTSTLNGTQMAGLFNVAKNVKGIQMAGLFNVAKKVEGSQLSVFNIADTCSGVSLGLFSFVRKGYHKLEFSADEVFYTNVSFRTGTNKFHNIFSVGLTPEKKNNQLWTYGYGIGTTWKIKERFWFDVDLSANNVFKVNSPLWSADDSASVNSRNGRLNLNNKIYAGIEWRMAKKLSLAAGPVFNIMLADERNSNYQDIFSKIRPNYIFNQKVSNHIFMNCWIGVRIALRFF